MIRTGDELERLAKALNRMIARLEDAFQHINRFSADASHELRTPLTILQLELESIARSPSLTSSLEDQIASTLEETNRMSRIVESLLTISRLDAGDARLEKVHLDLGEVAALTVAEMKILAQEKSISLRVSSDSDVYVEGDRSRLQQVIVNLVDNAIKYTREGGGAVVEVMDNGFGIAPDAVPHVFERFYRVDKARARASGGSGLGLSIVKAICAAHAGDVSVSSTEGQGSCFRVELPLLPVEIRDSDISLRKVVD